MRTIHSAADVTPALSIHLGNYAAQDPGGWQYVIDRAKAADEAGVDRVESPTMSSSARISRRTVGPRPEGWRGASSPPVRTVSGSSR